MCVFLFDAEFKEILFKVFILMIIVRLFFNYQIELSKQVNLLKSINILPIKLRFLRNYIRSLNSDLSSLHKTVLMAFILSYVLFPLKSLIYFYLIILFIR